jgi:hypothetical protein
VHQTLARPASKIIETKHVAMRSSKYDVEQDNCTATLHYHTSHITHHTSHITHHTSHILDITDFVVAREGIVRPHHKRCNAHSTTDSTLRTTHILRTSQSKSTCTRQYWADATAKAAAKATFKYLINNVAVFDCAKFASNSGKLLANYLHPPIRVITEKQYTW